MFTYYSLPWLQASYTLPVVYSRLVWWSMMYPSLYTSELWKAYWNSNLSAKTSPSTPQEEPVVSVLLEERPEMVIKVEPVTLEQPNRIEAEPLITLTVDEVQTFSIPQPETLPLPPQQKVENRKRVMKLLQSFAITQPEDINRLTLDRTKSLARALGISQSIQGEKKKMAVLKAEVKQRLLDSAFLD